MALQDEKILIVPAMKVHSPQRTGNGLHHAPLCRGDRGFPRMTEDLRKVTATVPMHVEPPQIDTVDQRSRFEERCVLAHSEDLGRLATCSIVST
jgi:hypothetical protein